MAIVLVALLLLAALIAALVIYSRKKSKVQMYAFEEPEVTDNFWEGEEADVVRNYGRLRNADSSSQEIIPTIAKQHPVRKPRRKPDSLRKGAVSVPESLDTYEVTPNKTSLLPLAVPGQTDTDDTHLQIPATPQVVPATPQIQIEPSEPTLLRHTPLQPRTVRTAHRDSFASGVLADLASLPRDSQLDSSLVQETIDELPPATSTPNGAYLPSYNDPSGVPLDNLSSLKAPASLNLDEYEEDTAL